MKSLITFSCALLMSLTPKVHGQDAPAALTLEDIYRNNSYPTRYYRSVRWLQDSEQYTTLEANPQENCSEIILYMANSGDRKVLIVYCEKSGVMKTPSISNMSCPALTKVMKLN
jgi:hypothetical protein